MIKKIVFCIIIVLIVSLIIGMLGYSIYENQKGVYNYDGKKSILEDLHYEVNILKDGNAIVKEQRTYSFLKGFFSRGYLEIEGNADQIGVVVDGKEYQEIDNFDSGRPEGRFAVEPSGTKTRIEWYYRSGEEDRKVFEIQYRVQGATTLYNDCADYFHKYVSSDNVYKIKNLSILVHLPDGADESNTDIWAHGPAGGRIEFEGDKKVLLTMKNVPAREYIEARFLMPTTVMQSSIEKVDIEKYQQLYERENKAAKDSDRERLIRGFISILVMVGSVLIIIFPIISTIKYRLKLKRLKPQLEPKYYRDLPSDIYPAELDYLMNHYTGKIDTSQQISSTLLDLINKGIIQGKIIEEGSMFGKKKDTVFTTQSLKWEDIATHEKALLYFLFNVVGKADGSVSLKEIKKFSANSKTAKESYKFYIDFESKVKSIVQGRRYFETKKNALPKRLTKTIIIYIVLIVFPMILMNMVDVLASTPIYYISIAAIIGLMILGIFGQKVKPLLTQKGEDQFALWKAFRTFLGDFTTFDKKELPELFMWEKYLVYATILGVAKKMLKQLYAKYPELNDISDNANLFYLIHEGNYNRSYQNFDEIGETIESAMRDAANIVSKASSQGSGGGFSSGGSDSGGGAGGSSGGVD